MARILVVDDNPASRNLLLRLLSYHGHSLLEASEGAEALRIAAEQRPELIIADILMPAMDGYELVQRMRTIPEIAETPVIFCSAHFRERDARELARQCGVARVVAKPCEPDAILQAIDACLEHRDSVPAPLVAESFDREHVRLLTDKLTQQAADLAAAKFRLQGLMDISLQLASESQSRQLFFKANPLPGWIYDCTSLRFLEVNDAAIRHYGYTRDEFLSMTIKDICAPDDCPGFLEQMSRPRGTEYAGRWRHRKKNGSLIDVEIFAYSLPGPAATEFVLAQDITERCSLEKQLRQAQKMEAIGRLAGGIAHDFNNLLGVITGYSDLLLKKVPETDSAHKALSQISKAADRAASLTKQLLAFSRRQIIQPQILDLNGIVVGMETMLRRLIGEDIHLMLVCHPNLWSVNVDAGQLEQVLMNLIVNARDAMPQGGRITIETANVDWHGGHVEHLDVPAGPYVMLAVSDTGSGMSEEVRSHVFEPFFTTKSEGKGTGLGLSTVYGIVKQSEGYVWVYSEVDVGTTFKIYLPAIKGAQPVAQEQPVLEPLRQRTETVLVVEDQEMFRDMISEVLDQNGYDVLIAHDAGDALRICDQYRETVDLVITDVVMPNMSGPQLAEQISARYPNIKILFMSGYADDAIVHHGILSHDKEFLQKPFTPDSLLHKVQAVLDSPVPAGAEA